MLRLVAPILVLPLLLAAAGGPTHRVRHDFALVHEGPGYATTITAELAAGAEVRVERVQGEWALVAGKGWVLVGFLERLAEAPARPAAAPRPEEEAPPPAAPEAVAGPTAGQACEACEQRLESLERRMEEACRAAVSEAEAGADREAAAAAAAREDAAAAAEQVNEMRRALDGAGAAARDWDGLNRRLQEREMRTAALLDEMEEIRRELARREEQLEEQRKIAREAGRAEGEEKSRAEADEREAGLRAGHERELRAGREQAERDRAEAVEAARAREHARIEAFLDEMDEMKKVQAARERERAEGETALMHEAGLRKLRLQMEREKEQALERQGRNLRRENDAALLKAIASAEKEFRKRLDQIREDESQRHRRSLEALRAALEEEGPEGDAGRRTSGQERLRCEEALAELREMMEADRERIVRSEVDRALREERGRRREAEQTAGDAGCAEERRRCDHALAGLRADLEGKQDHVVEREVARALREERRSVQAAAGEGEQAAEGVSEVPAAVPDRVACRQAIQRTLERARAEWQAETALYVERAVERARQRWEAEK